MPSEVRPGAELELGRRLPVGALAHALCVFVVGFGTPLARTAPILFTVFAVLMAASIAGRLWLMRVYLSWLPTRRNEWNDWMTRCLAASAFLWGVLFAFVFDLFGLTSPASHLVFLLGSGIAAAGTVTLAADRPRATWFVLLSLGIPMVWLFSRWEADALAVGFICVAYCGFLLAQITLKAREYQEHLAAQDAISEHVERLQQVLDAIPGFVSWIGPDMCYRGVNRHLASSLGLALPEIVGRRLGSMTPTSPFVAAVIKFASGNQEEATHEVPLPTSNGERWHVVKMRRGAGEIFLVSIDIHDMKKAEEALGIERARAAFAAKMASLGEMASGIAHEINNPLAIITGSADALRRRAKAGKINPEEIVAEADRVEKTAMRIGKIVRALLAIARDADQDPRQDTPVATIVAEALDLCSERFKKHRIRLDVPEIPESCQLVCRPTQLVQALTNLLNNAFDAVEEAEEKEVRIEVDRNEDTIDIAVVDSGSGVASEHRSRLLEPFFTTKPVGKGTGLGLSITSSIAEAHQGSLFLDVRSSRTRFVLRLAAPKVPAGQKRAA